MRAAGVSTLSTGCLGLLEIPYNPPPPHTHTSGHQHFPERAFLERLPLSKREEIQRIAETCQG